jgi:anaerobic glycerol-3-phosphate dehydrogenase
MNLLDAIKRDIAQIQNNSNEYAVVCTFTRPNNSVFTVKGVHTKHHLGVDTDGLPINSKTASISFSEVNLPNGVSVRNNANEVRMINWRVSVKDSTGANAQYIVREVFPDEMLGTIVCILGDYA